MSLKGYSDPEIIKLLQSDNEEVVWLIFDEYWESLFLLAFSIVKERFIAEDIVQETITAFWKRRNKLTIEHSIKAYLFASVRYASYKKWKTLRNNDESLEGLTITDSHSPLEDLLYKDLKSTISKVVNALPERCKQVYLLSREDQLSHKEIAEQMNISTKTVENQLTKALRALRISLEKIPFIVIIFHFTR